MWEQAPCLRTIQVINIFDKELTLFHLKLPYLIFVLGYFPSRMSFSNCNLLLLCGCSNKPIKSLDDHIYFPPLSNIYEGLTVCLGDAITPYDLKEAVTLFWSTSFYEGSWLGDFIRNKISIGSYAEWGETSKECPDLLEDLDWSSFYWGTLREMARHDREVADNFKAKMYSAFI